MAGSAGCRHRFAPRLTQQPGASGDSASELGCQPIDRLRLAVTDRRNLGRSGRDGLLVRRPDPALTLNAARAKLVDIGCRPRRHTMLLDQQGKGLLRSHPAFAGHRSSGGRQPLGGCLPGVEIRDAGLGLSDQCSQLAGKRR